MRIAMMSLFLLVAACGRGSGPTEAPDALPLFPNETPELRLLINEYADLYSVPRALVHRVIVRESTHQPGARNGPYYGLMQILPATARGMGYSGPDAGLLDAEVNLRWAVKYLRGAYLVAEGDFDDAVMWYARGYYYAARDACLLVETGLRQREVARHCR